MAGRSCPIALEIALQSGLEEYLSQHFYDEGLMATRREDSRGFHLMDNPMLCLDISRTGSKRYLLQRWRVLREIAQQLDVVIHQVSISHLGGTFMTWRCGRSCELWSSTSSIEYHEFGDTYIAFMMAVMQLWPNMVQDFSNHMIDRSQYEITLGEFHFMVIMARQEPEEPDWEEETEEMEEVSQTRENLNLLWDRFLGLM